MKNSPCQSSALTLPLIKTAYIARVAMPSNEAFFVEKAKKDGPIVYRLGRQVFILVRGVRFPLGLRV